MSPRRVCRQGGAIPLPVLDLQVQRLKRWTPHGKVPAQKQKSRMIEADDRMRNFSFLKFLNSQFFSFLEHTCHLQVHSSTHLLPSTELRYRQTNPNITKIHSVTVRRAVQAHPLLTRKQRQR